MRDTQRLRSRIAILASLAAAPACGSPSPAPEPVAKADAQAGKDDTSARGRKESARDRYYREKAEREGKPVDDVKPAAMRGKAEAAVREADDGGEDEAEPSPAPAGGAPGETAPGGHGHGAPVAGAIPGDPPYIDGYNPEEETCPSGNWCGPKDAANKIAMAEGTDDTLGCPSRLTGGRRPNGEEVKIEGGVYEGLSSKHSMQASFNEHGTELRRADGEGDTCCYHWFEYCAGRPHVGENGPVRAGVRETTTPTSWAGHARAVADGMDPELAARIADGWSEDAQMEHASVAAFARATLELMSVGAPAELLAGCQRAALDEIDHARRLFTLAGCYGGRELAPGPLPALAPRSADLSRLAADTFAEGCAGESIAALAAERALRSCIDPAVRDALEVIATDEARHAALAWATVRWAVNAGGDVVREAVRRRAADLRAASRGALPQADARASALAEAGRLDARALAETSRDAWAEIIDPLLDAALA
jgi:hypothetical protein